MEVISPSIAKLRISIVTAIAVGVVSGVAYFYERSLLNPSHDRRALHGFLMLSLMGIALIVPYLWSDWLLRRHVKYFEVAFVVILGPGAVFQFSHDKPLQGILSGVISLTGLIAILPRLLRPVKIDGLETDTRTTVTDYDKQSSVPSRRQSARYFGMLLIWLVTVELSTSHIRGPIPLWIKVAFALPALWLVWKMVFPLSKSRSD
jgi:hypothetical protein